MDFALHRNLLTLNVSGKRALSYCDVKRECEEFVSVCGLTSSVRRNVNHNSGFGVHYATYLVNDHPVRSSIEASRLFLDLAHTPPHEEGYIAGFRPPRRMPG